MSYTLNFQQALASLQVMSPVSTIKFAHSLSNSANYEDWLDDFEYQIGDIFTPLSNYIQDNNNKFTDFESKEIPADSPAGKNALSKYNNLIYGLLSNNVSPEIAASLEGQFHNIRKIDPHYGKTLLHYLQKKYGEHTLKDVVATILEYTKIVETSYIQNHNVVRRMQSIAKQSLFSAAIIVATAGSREKVLEKYGTKTKVEITDIIDYVHEQEAKVSTHQTFLSSKRRTRRGKGRPKSKDKGHNQRNSNQKESKEQSKVCSSCHGNHHMSECDKFAATVAPKDNVRFANFALEQAEPGPTWLASNAFTAFSETNEIPWFIDSGCSNHMTSERDLYEKFNPHHISTIQGVGASVHSSGIRTLNVGDYKLRDVEYVPKAPVNLLSVSQYVESSGQCMIFTPSHVYVGDVPRDVLQSAHVLGERSKDLYKLTPEKPSSFWTLDLGNGLSKGSSSSSSTSSMVPDSTTSVVSPSTTSVSADIWHARLGHPGAVIYDKLSREIPLPKTPKKEFEVCPSCTLSKGTIRKGPVSLNNATAPLQLIQVDVCGQFRYHEYIDSKLFLTIRDSYSHFYSAFPLKNKAEATTKLMNWIIEQEKFYSTRGGFQVCVVRTDNGREFDNKILHEFFMDRGIVHQFTVPHQSFQNGAVERAHRTLQNTVRALLIHGGGVPPFLWSEALSCAVYLINRMPIITRKGQIPYKNWHCYKMVNLDLSHLRTFGCAAYAVIPVPNRDGKLAPTSVSGVMVGYAPEQKGYKIYVPHTGKTYVSNQVRFDEMVFPLSESVASHKAYDKATSALPGIPKYPSTSTEPSEIQPPRMVQPLITVAPSSSDNTIEKALSQQDELLANQNQLDQANKQLNDQQEELVVSGQNLSKEYERLSHSHTENTQELFNRTEELAERQGLAALHVDYLIAYWLDLIGFD